jgi:hypothetical protein
VITPGISLKTVPSEEGMTETEWQPVGPPVPLTPSGVSDWLIMGIYVLVLFCLIAFYFAVSLRKDTGRGFVGSIPEAAKITLALGATITMMLLFLRSIFVWLITGEASLTGTLIFLTSILGLGAMTAIWVREPSEGFLDVIASDTWFVVMVLALWALLLAGGSIAMANSAHYFGATLSRCRGGGPGLYQRALLLLYGSAIPIGVGLVGKKIPLLHAAFKHWLR